MHEESLIGIIKRAAVEALEAAKPVSVVFGKVMAPSPLSVRIDQKLVLSADMLVLTGSTSRLESAYGESGKAEIRPALKAGDEVILLRVQGGQKYILLDKVVN